MKVTIEKDYDGYFGALVQKLVTEKEQAGGQFKHAEVKVTAGPYRSYAVSYKSQDEVIALDFYSALRTGFGSLSAEDLVAVKELL